MMRIQSYRGLLAAAVLLVLASSVSAQEFRATVRGQVVDSSKAALPGATVTVRNQETGEVATATTNNEGNYTVPFLRPGLYSVTVEMSGFQKLQPDRHASPGEPDRGHQCAARSRRRDRKRQCLGGGAAARDEQRRPRHGHRQRAHRRAAAAVAQPDGARRARRRRQLQRPGGLPPSVRQRRARRLVDERRSEQQQRVPARRRAEQRQPGRQQHRLRAAGGSRAGNEDFHELVRRAVRPHRRRRRQHVAQVGHQLVPRRRLRLHAPQGPGRQLVPAQLAQQPEDRSVHRSVRVQRRWPDLEEQDVLPVHRREVPRRHARAAVQHGADPGVQEW